MFDTKLKTMYPELSYAETKIADFILANRESVLTLTSQQLADQLGVSQTTVIRFSKTLGYRSYGKLMLDIEKSETADETVEEIQVSDSTASTNLKIKTYTVKLLEAVDEFNPPEEFDRAVRLILKAKTIYCFGFLATSSMAHYMNGLLQLFGLNSYCLDHFETMSAMRNQGSDGLLIVFSKSGQTTVTNEVARRARERKLCVLGITNLAPNALSANLDVWLKVIYSPLKTRFLHYTETTAQMYIIDCLVLNLFKHDVAAYAEQATDLRKLTRGSRKG